MNKNYGVMKTVVCVGVHLEDIFFLRGHLEDIILHVATCNANYIIPCVFP